MRRFGMRYVFCCAADHRDLHSFPTRRSSDLGIAGWGSKTAAAIFSQYPHLEDIPKDWRHWDPMRSEEHTSELQSRVDLVCRLLLEKKKATDSGRTLGV